MAKNASMFTAQIIGYIGFVKKLTLPKGLVYSISVGVTVPATDKSLETVEWVECLLGGALAQAIGGSLESGQMIFAGGPYKNTRFTHKDGTPGFAGRLRAAEFRFLGAAAGHEAASNYLKE